MSSKDQDQDGRRKEKLKELLLEETRVGRGWVRKMLGYEGGDDERGEEKVS